MPRSSFFLVRVIPTTAALAVALASFALSYVALRDVAARSHAVPQNLAFLLPVCVDGAVLAASATAWANSLRGKRMDPIALIAAVTLLSLSVAVNMAHAGPSVMAKTLAAVPPLTLLVCLELVAGAYRGDVLAHRQDATETADRTTAREPRDRPAHGENMAAAAVARPVPVKEAPPTHPRAPRAQAPAGGTYAAVRGLLAAHVETGGDLADTTLAPRIAAELALSPATARKHLGAARRELATI